MKAVQIQAHGGLETLKVTTLPDPEPGAGEVLVRIRASAVNPLDGIVRMGVFPIAKTPPVILGEEAAGVVEQGGGGSRRGSPSRRGRPSRTSASPRTERCGRPS